MMNFVLVNSIRPKDAPMLVNLDLVTEIVPLVEGGCTLFFNNTISGGEKNVTVSDDFSVFQYLVKHNTIECDSKPEKAVSPANVKLGPGKMSPRPEVKLPRIKDPDGTGVQLDIPTFGKSNSE